MQVLLKKSTTERQNVKYSVKKQKEFLQYLFPLDMFKLVKDTFHKIKDRFLLLKYCNIASFLHSFPLEIDPVFKSLLHVIIYKIEREQILGSEHLQTT